MACGTVSINVPGMRRQRKGREVGAVEEAYCFFCGLCIVYKDYCAGSEEGCAEKGQFGCARHWVD